MSPAPAEVAGLPKPIGPDAASRRDFILANTEVLSPPHVPELRLHLASEAFGLWRRTEEELQQIGLPPPYWAFAWAGGQALARYLLDNQDIARGRTVIDIGTGCGIAAIAAGMCGAASVAALDIDPFALTAANLNAELNTVAIAARIIKPGEEPKSLIGSHSPASLILLGDVFYERPLAERMQAFGKAAVADGHDVLVGDPSRAYLPADGCLHEIACYEVPVTRALEDAEIRRSRVFRFVR